MTVHSPSIPSISLFPSKAKVCRNFRTQQKICCNQGHQKTFLLLWANGLLPLNLLFVTIVYSLILRNPLFTGFLWQHTFLIPMLPPWILVFSLIFKFFILYLFLRVWSLALFDKSSVIPRATVGSSQSSLPAAPTPFVLPVVPVSGNSFTARWATLVGNTSCFGSFLSLISQNPTDARFCCSYLLIISWHHLLFISLSRTLPFPSWTTAAD